VSIHFEYALRTSEIRGGRGRDHHSGAEHARVFGADDFRPIAGNRTVSHPCRPCRREDGGILDGDLDLQTLPFGICINRAPAVERAEELEWKLCRITKAAAFEDPG